MNISSPGAKLQKYLMASYLYYVRFQSVMPDAEYDLLAKDLLEAWDNFEHYHKHLVTIEDLRAGTLFRLKDKDYPEIVKQGAEIWLRGHQDGKMAGG